MPRLLPKLFGLILLAGMLCQPAAAQQPAAPVPQTPLAPVSVPPDAQRAPESFASPEALAAINTPLKAVVFTGPIDGDNGSWTLDEIKNAQMAAAALRSYGVSVEEFYPNQPNGTWENIKAAANGAHFLIYRGHGVYWSGMPAPVVGGFYLKNNVFVSNEMIRSELHPAQNFLVMLYGCFTAGSSGNDESSIDVNEARRRVGMYSDPFFDLGAGGYYADWFGAAFPSYIHSLFQGKTQRQAYEAFFDYNPGMVWRGAHPDYPAMSLYLGWDNWYAPLPNWNNAFAGAANKTLADLFDTRMVLSTHQFAYLAEEGFPALMVNVAIDSTSTTTFHWTVNSAGLPAWLSLAGPSQGEAGEDLLLRIDPAQAGGVERFSLAVDANSPEIGDGSQEISAALWIISEVKFIFLPAIGK